MARRRECAPLATIGCRCQWIACVFKSDLTEREAWLPLPPVVNKFGADATAEVVRLPLWEVNKFGAGVVAEIVHHRLVAGAAVVCPRLGAVNGFGAGAIAGVVHLRPRADVAPVPDQKAN